MGLVSSLVKSKRITTYVAISIFKERNMAFGIKTKEEPGANPNELVFKKAKGFDRYNYATITTKVSVEETVLVTEQTKKVIFSKAKVTNDSIEYGQIAAVELKKRFAKVEMIGGIVTCVLAMILAITGVFGEEGPGILYGPIFLAVMLFCAYEKDIIITKKDSSKLVIMAEGFFQGKEIMAFRQKLAEHGIEMKGVK
jgi:hypothetical protein